MKPLLAAVLLLAATPALAHHSYAMFDRIHTRTIVGTVKAYEHVNPHGYLDVLVTTKSGKVQEWAIESPSVAVMQQSGVKRETFKPGDKITLVIYPLRDGTTGGQFVNATLANGTIVGDKKPGFTAD